MRPRRATSCSPRCPGPCSRGSTQRSSWPLGRAHFLESGAASLLLRTKRDDVIEVSVVSRSSVVEVPLVLGTGRSPHRCVVQRPGEALRIEAGALPAVMEESPALRLALFADVQALLVQNSLMLACNARRRIEERLARWLLTRRDRLRSDEIALTHALLAQSLGVRRAGVTLALGRLEARGAVRRGGRGRVLVADADLLRQATCECCALVRRESDRLLGVQRR